MPKTFKSALKVKVVSLGLESRVIRREESRASTCWEHFQLRYHRLFTVRTATREAHLAYGFLKGMPYRKIERTNESEPNWKAVEKMVVKYGIGPSVSYRDRGAYEIELMDRFSKWRSEPGFQ